VAPITLYLFLSALVFAVGAAGFVFRRNVLVMFMCLELMLNGAAISFAAFSRRFAEFDGQAAALFVIAAAAAEAAVGLGLIVLLHRAAKSVDSSGASELSG